MALNAVSSRISMVLFFSLKNGRSQQVHKTGLGRQALRNRVVLPSRLLWPQWPKTVFWQADLRYETTNKYDDNLNYDKFFKPAYLSLFSILAHIVCAKLPSTKKYRPNCKRTTHLAGGFKI
jgi:hypothetical protein